MTNLSASQITKLTTLIDGQPRGRLSSTAKTVLRLHKTLAEAIGLPLADTAVNNAMACATYGEAEAIIKTAVKMGTGETPKAVLITDPAFAESPEAKANAASWDAIPAIRKARSKAALRLVEASAPAATEKPKRERKAAAEPKVGKRAEVLEAAKRGEMPTAPDFTANTHKPFRKKLEAVVALVEAGDIAALRAFEIKPVSSSPKAIAKYRDLAVIALEARAAKGAAA